MVGFGPTFWSRGSAARPSTASRRSRWAATSGWSGCSRPAPDAGRRRAPSAAVPAAHRGRPGQDSARDESSPATRTGSSTAARRGKRIVVMFGGPFMNLSSRSCCSSSCSSGFGVPTRPRPWSSRSASASCPPTATATPLPCPRAPTRTPGGPPGSRPATDRAIDGTADRLVGRSWSRSSGRRGQAVAVVVARDGAAAPRPSRSRPKPSRPSADGLGEADAAAPRDRVVPRASPRSGR